MPIRLTLVTAWYQATLLALMPWIAPWHPGWVPLLLAMAIVVRPLQRRSGPAEPWAGLLVALSSLVFLLVFGGWAVGSGWLFLAVLVIVMRLTFSARRGGIADAATVVGLLGWGAAFALQPQLIATDHGGWLAPALLLLMVPRLASCLLYLRSVPALLLGPPSREVRGTLSLHDAVLKGHDDLPRSAPLDLELRAGESLAIVCDAPLDVDALAQVLSGRRRPVSGELAIDGAPLADGEVLIAMVAPGEPFLRGDLEENLAALCSDELAMETVVAVTEACSLHEIREILEDRALSADGEPLSPLDRLMVQAARVIPSSYRVLVVVDPQPWVNTVRGEMWRAAVVRASVGRTAIWITSDRELARRAGRRMEMRHGALRSSTMEAGEGSV